MAGSYDPKVSAGSGFFSVDRLVGIAVALAGVWLLLYGIPAGVGGRSADFPSPHLFPQIAAGVFVVGGVLQAIQARPGRALPDLREVLRFVLVSGLVLAMAWAMGQFGFIIGGMAFLAALMVVVFERRLLWVAVSVIALPIGLWLFFEVLLQRPLP